MARVLALTGGPSPEKFVSVASARHVADVLQVAGVEVDLYDIGNDGRLGTVEVPADLAVINEDLSFDPPSFCETLARELRQLRSKAPYACALALGQGGPIESGLVPRLLEELGLRVFPAPASTIEIAGNKRRMREVFRRGGIPSLRYAFVAREQLEGAGWDLSSHLAAFPGAVVVKPDCTGSSVGVSGPGSRASQFAAAVPLWQRLGCNLIVEEYAAGAEYTCGCVRIAGSPHVLGVVRKEKAAGVLSFQSKYGDDPGYRKVKLSDGDRKAAVIRAMVGRLAEAVPDLLWFRADFMETADGRIAAIDFNPIPYFSADSTMYVSMIERGIEPRRFFAAALQSLGAERAAEVSA
jgi:D-alanine--D-alanine ligase